MDNPFYHRGLTIEFDAHIPRLTVDGQEVPLPSGVLGGRDPAVVGRDALIQLAQQHVDASQEIGKRDTTRDEHLRTLAEGVKRWNEWRQENPEVRPLLYGAKLRGKDLRAINLANANLIGADLKDTNLTSANFHEANLGGADLTGATLAKANLCRTDLFRAKMMHADLTSANLQGTHLAKTDFAGADLVHCRIYGLAAWDLNLDESTKQRDLEIVYEKDSETPDGRRELGRVVVDDLRVAQFIYLLLHNRNIRDVIDTVSSKAVLILGRFRPEERKAVLDALRNRLRTDYVPILFDFDKPSNRDFTETIKVLAGLSRFIIADITNPRAAPLEMGATIPDYMVPFVPIIQAGEEPFKMFLDLQQKYDWVLDVLEYDSVTNLLAVLDRAVIRPALEKADQILLKKAEALRKRHVADYR
jgi:pentapeptide repeat protein